MGTYKMNVDGMDNPAYMTKQSATEKPFGGFEQGSSSSSSLEPQGSATNRLWVAILVTFVLTACLAAGITYPITKNAYDTPCEAATSTKPSMESTTNPAPKTTEKPPPMMASSTTPRQGVLRSVTASTPYGDVIGHEVDMGTGNSLDNIMSYKGIPYSKPPGRWEKPSPPDPWTTPLVGDTFGNTCDGNGNLNESCLYLNVYSPMDASQTYPVMFWIHGGGYQNGASNGFPGHELAARGVVVVTINYRLGIFGFASGAGGLLPGNYGLWDQLQAMIFVKDTVAGFGGDPDRVTIFGESAGAGSVGLHLLSPYSDGYFKRAILESGNELVLWAANTPIDEPDTYIRQVADEVGCGNGSSDAEMVACLKGVDAKTLNAAPIICPFCLGFEPVVDGDFLPAVPADMLRNGTFNDVDIMMGTNHDECNGFLLDSTPWFAFMGASRLQFERGLVAIVDYFWYVTSGVSNNATTVHELYEALDFMYSPWPDIYNASLLRDQLGQACTDVAFAAPTNQVARYHSSKVKVHLYVYDVRYSGLRLAPEWVGVHHGYELNYVFGHPQISNGTQSLKDDVDIKLNQCWTSEDDAWSSYIITLWTNYAKTGDPTPEPVAPPNMEPEVWEPFNNATFSYFYINNDVVANMENYRMMQTAFVFDYLWWIARNEHFDDIHALPESEVVLNEDIFQHYSVRDLDIIAIMEERIKYLNSTGALDPMNWESLLDGPWQGRKRRSAGDGVHSEGIGKPPMDLPNPFGHGYLQDAYDNLTYTEYLALQGAIRHFKQQHGAQISTVQDFLALVLSYFPDLLQHLKDFLAAVNWGDVAEKGQEAARYCGYNVTMYLQEQYPRVLNLLEILGLHPLGL